MASAHAGRSRRRSLGCAERFPRSARKRSSDRSDATDRLGSATLGRRRPCVGSRSDRVLHRLPRTSWRYVSSSTRLAIGCFACSHRIGVRNLWRLPEETASKALADLTLLSHKVPIELFEGRRTLPHDLFARDDVEVYLDASPQSGRRRAFLHWVSRVRSSCSHFTKRLAHRMGLASWGGMSAASDEQLATLGAHFEQLDASESFVHPHKALFAVCNDETSGASGDACNRGDLFGHASGATPQQLIVNEGDLFSRICASWDDVPSPEREIGIARDVIVVQMGSQSNLFAAMAWTVIFALRHPSIVDQILTEGDGVLDSFSHESIRMSQRSIVLRRVVTPIEVADEKATYRVSPARSLRRCCRSPTSPPPKGSTSSTSTTTEARFFFVQMIWPHASWSPPTAMASTPAPAHRFSTSAIRHSVGELFRRYELSAEFDAPLPLPRQIGGVARADRPCKVRYRARS